jgi:Flp pilus assembly protein TadG
MGMDRQESVRGQGLLEFVVSLAVLILIFLGVFDLGRAFHSFIVITNAAREGAYYGSMHPKDEIGIKARVINEAQNSGVIIDGDRVYVDTEIDAGSGNPVSGAPMCVTVEYDFFLVTTYLLGYKKMQLTSNVEMANY